MTTSNEHNNAPAVPLGYINAGHLHEMQSGRLPYAYLYAAPGVGVEIPVYTSNAPAVPQGDPTEEMLVAGLKECEPLGELIDWREGFGRSEMRAVWEAMLGATPAPAPAQEVGLTEQRTYRLLQAGIDKIEAADEFLSDDTNTWAVDPNGIFVGMTYMGNVLRPGRRAIIAALRAKESK